jgi:hypothetical protein
MQFLDVRLSPVVTFTAVVRFHPLASLWGTASYAAHPIYPGGTVAKTKSKSTLDRKGFRQKLNAAQQATFDLLCDHLDQPHTDLGWYHRLGMLLLGVVPESENERRIRWLQDNAKQLGARESLLQKASRFYREYPRQQDIRRLERLGTDWTRVYIAFPVQDVQARYRLLAESLRKGWTHADLRFEVQRRYPNKRHGVGGRPESTKRAHGPEVALREMQRFTSRWLAFHDEAWSKIKPAG